MGDRWRDLEPWQRYSIAGVGTVAVGSLVFWGVRALMRPEPFQDIGPQCSDFSLANRQEIDDALVPMVREAASRGAVDPFSVATRFVKRYAPECRSYPSEPRNAGEGQLYVAAFNEVLRVLEAEGLSTSAQQSYFSEMVGVWATAHGVPGFA